MITADMPKAATPAAVSATLLCTLLLPMIVRLPLPLRATPHRPTCWPHCGT
jgi:hypothetical protein